ncbi:AIG2 family protein [Desulfurobacterium thermolithotrophum DSM 11699]|uniref:AIG2 family protein n=1 Tax=Desulfurobacterium thermolithotrophum (strain DSM 11699 / BSA) TaxID=868864 RepID=F0S1P4_DESTD|nr:gamma-glutamylcyclotransferase family protein [Desulfurobacterium thermolithotrophum]ADY72899.1 AIG2 family protein [Desulfurobacterium thermolithotrophum DSM 11699]
MYYELLFVYGTLMSGLSAHTFLFDSEFVGHGILYGAKLLHLEEGYPGVIEGEGEVFGEVYRVDSLTLAAIDLFEEFYKSFPERSFYLRIRKPIRLIQFNDFVDAWVYVLNPLIIKNLSFTEVPFGNWKEFIKKLMKL